MRLACVILPLVLLVACGEDAAPASAPAPAAKADPPAPPPAPAPAAGGDMDVTSLNAAREAHVGQDVTARGYLLGTTRQGDPVTQINISVGAAADIKAESVICIADPADESFEGLAQKSEITVKGKVAEKDFFGKTMLEGCTLAR